MKRALPVLLVLALGAAVAVSDAALSHVTPVRQTAGASSTSVYANLAGQFRSVIANVLWMKADTYHHEYVERGGSWGKESDILPLMRMITVLDPHFTQAYAAGGWMLGLYQNRPAEGRAFLREGLANNPDSPELNETMGILAWKCDGNAAGALAFFEKAAAGAKTQFDKVRLERSAALLRQRIRER